MQMAVPDEDEPRVVGHLTPFMEIESDRIRALNSGETRSNIRGKHGECAVSAIDMEPYLFLTGDTGDGSQIIDRAGVDRAGSCGYEEGGQAGAFILGDSFRQCLDIDLVLLVHWNDA